MSKQVQRLVTKSALRVVELERLQTDSSYQREVKAKHKKIVSEFNEDALGIPLVGEREDGSLWIVDGLQRKTALVKMGRKTVRAEVFASRGPEHEAEVFKLVNLNRTKLNQGEQFKALLAAHDPTAWEIKKVVEECGYTLTLSATGMTGKRRAGGMTNDDKASKQVSCFNTLRWAYQYCGIESIRFALTVVDKAWPGDRLNTYQIMFGGLCVFYQRRDGVVDLDRLIPRMQSVTAQKVLYAASQNQIGNSKQQAVADVMEKVYNKRLPRNAGK